MLKINPLLCVDGYKVHHHIMYPKNTSLVFSNFTTRNVKYMPSDAKDIVVFGTQYTFKFIKDLFDENFFNLDKNIAISEIKKYLDSYTGSNYSIEHFSELYDLGYLPINVYALPEGTVLKNPNIPMMVYWNTLPEFYWVTNFLETIISTTLWKPVHSASIAYGFRKILTEYCLKTNPDAMDFVDFQAHDFSMRGMQSVESATTSAMGFSTSFKGSDTLSVLQYNDYYYGTPNSVFSVPASEHAVMTAYGKENEEIAFSRILDLYPTGIVSIVSDSYDFWKIHTETIYKLKDQIMSRDGKTVFRGDSGDPVDIICGSLRFDSIQEYNDELLNGTLLQANSAEKGQIELLWDCFGGTVNEQGYKVLDSHVGAIYGDGITLERAKEICKRLEAKGFASTNVVFGIGSYSLGYASRDSQGVAVKATACVVDGEFREIFKDPITDIGKKSAKGLLSVFKNDDGMYYLKSQCEWDDVRNCEFINIFRNGEQDNLTTLSEIREQLM